MSSSLVHFIHEHQSTESHGQNFRGHDRPGTQRFCSTLQWKPGTKFDRQRSGCCQHFHMPDIMLTCLVVYISQDFTSVSAVLKRTQTCSEWTAWTKQYLYRYNLKSKLWCANNGISGRMTLKETNQLILSQQHSTVNRVSLIELQSDYCSITIFLGISDTWFENVVQCLMSTCWLSRWVLNDIDS